MAVKTNFESNGKQYYRITRTVGRRLNENEVEVPVKKVFYGASKKEAEEKYEAFLDKKRNGLATETKYFGIMAENWIYDFLANDTKLKSRTKELYIGQWNKYVKPSDLYYMRLEDIQASTIQKFYNTQQFSASGLKAVDKVMKRFYRYLELEGFARNITHSLVLPQKSKPVTKDDNEVVVWTDEEIDAILNGFDKAQKGFRLRFLLVLGYYTGCRVGDLLGLTYNDFKGNTLSINKQAVRRVEFNQNGKTEYFMDIDTSKSKSSYRMLPLNSDVLEELELHRKWQREDMLKNGYRTKYLFTTDSGKLYDRHNITHACDRYYKRIGVKKKGFHTYRHTFGTNLCRKGVAIQVASKLLGHADINVTAKYYVDVALEEKQAAVELLAGVINR